MLINIAAAEFEFVKNGLIEILGQIGFDSLVSTKNNEAEKWLAGNLYEELTKQYGNSAAKGFMIRAGRSSFYYWMRQYASNYGWREPGFRYRLTRSKIKQGIHDLGSWFEVNTNLRITFDDTEKYWDLLINKPSQTITTEALDFLAGIFQEFMVWAGGGRFYQVRTFSKTNNAAQEFRLLLYKETID